MSVAVTVYPVTLAPWLRGAGGLKLTTADESPGAALTDCGELGTRATRMVAVGLDGWLSPTSLTATTVK